MALADASVTRAERHALLFCPQHLLPVIEAGEPPRVIAEKARDMMSDLIVMSAHGKSTLEQLFLSDVVERTIRQTTSPFLFFDHSLQAPGSLRSLA